MRSIINRGPIRVYWHRSGYKWSRFGEGRNRPWFQSKKRAPYSGGHIWQFGRLAVITGKKV